MLLDPGIGYVIEPPTSPEVPSPQSILPQELDKHDYALIGSMLPIMLISVNLNEFMSFWSLSSFQK